MHSRVFAIFSAVITIRIFTSIRQTISCRICQTRELLQELRSLDIRLAVGGADYFFGSNLNLSQALGTKACGRFRCLARHGAPAAILAGDGRPLPLMTAPPRKRLEFMAAHPSRELYYASEVARIYVIEISPS